VQRSDRVARGKLPWHRALPGRPARRRPGRLPRCRPVLGLTGMPAVERGPRPPARVRQAARPVRRGAGRWGGRPVAGADVGCAPVSGSDATAGPAGAGGGGGERHRRAGLGALARLGRIDPRPGVPDQADRAELDARPPRCHTTGAAVPGPAVPGCTGSSHWAGSGLGPVAAPARLVFHLPAAGRRSAVVGNGPVRTWAATAPSTFTAARITPAAARSFGPSCGGCNIWTSFN